VSRGIYVVLPEEERRALFDEADREWRSPRDQAAKLICDALRDNGALSTGERPQPPATGPGEAA
jgi:hypothetical protein